MQNGSNKKFYWFLVISIIIGLSPMLLYPFSGYYGKKEFYSGWLHSPIYQFPGGDYNVSPPNFAITVMQVTTLLTVLMFLTSLLITIYLLIRKKYKLGLFYLIPCFLNITLLILSLNLVGWLILID